MRDACLDRSRDFEPAVISEQYERLYHHVAPA